MPISPYVPALSYGLFNRATRREPEEDEPAAPFYPEIAAMLRRQMASPLQRTQDIYAGMDEAERSIPTKKHPMVMELRGGEKRYNVLNRGPYGTDYPDLTPMPHDVRRNALVEAIRQSHPEVMRQQREAAAAPLLLTGLAQGLAKGEQPEIDEATGKPIPKMPTMFDQMVEQFGGMYGNGGATGAATRTAPPPEDAIPSIAAADAEINAPLLRSVDEAMSRRVPENIHRAFTPSGAMPMAFPVMATPPTREASPTEKAQALLELLKDLTPDQRQVVRARINQRLAGEKSLNKALRQAELDKLKGGQADAILLNMLQALGR